MRVNEKVNYQFKLLYAFGMIFIVAGHCGNGGISLFYDWMPPYAFHIGLFVFASGYFYKESNEQEIWKYIQENGLESKVVFTGFKHV